jgi:hypothetical protein
MKDFELVFISKGVLANILATGCAENVFGALPYRCAILDSALTSLPVLWDISSENETMIDCQEIISDLLKKRLLHLFSFQREQYFHNYLLLGRYLREELADLFMIASVQNAAVAVDDPIIKKRVMQLLPNMLIPTTLTIFHRWFTLMRLPVNEIQSALHQVVQRSHFQPSEHDPLYSWWNQFFVHEEPLKAEESKIKKERMS